MQDSATQAIQRLAQRLASLQRRFVLEQHLLPPPHYAQLPDARPLSAHRLEALDWRPLAYHTYWGTWQTNFLMRFELRLPPDWDITQPSVLHLPLGEAADDFQAHPEALIYADGALIASMDVRHTQVLLPSHLCDGRAHELLLHGWTGLGGSLEGDLRPRYYLQPCAVQRLDTDLVSFYNLARNVLEVIQHTPPEFPPRGSLIAALENAFAHFDAHGMRRALTALLKALEAMPNAHPMHLYAVGHAHIDTAWLWTLDQTRGKAARTFQTAVSLLDSFPHYYFVQSQPQLYAFVQQDYPNLFEHICRHVTSGRWEALGGMWVEADCNISGAESLARQFLLGRRYFRQHFGADADSPILWMPDTFGFPASLPQLARLAGISYFFTTKLRWSEHNQIPHDSFWWEGLDGSRLLTHFTPTPMLSWLRTATYNANANAQSVIESWLRLHDKERVPLGLMVYGYGDGGGGPTLEMLENIAALQLIPNIPRLHTARARDFFEHLAQHGDKLPVWRGELYLETHQGTLTSQAWIKRANRKAEITLHNTEFLAALAYAHAKQPYPSDQLNALWQTLCLHQFHDILPGSSIAEVYAQARPEYARLQATCEQLSNAALQALSGSLGGDYLAVNTLSVSAPTLALLPEQLPSDKCLWHGETPLPAQQTEEGTLIALPALPPYSLTPLRLAQGASSDLPTLIATPERLENDLLALTFNSAGDLVGIYDKEHNRHVLAEGTLGNQFQAFHDAPRMFDAWNIDPLDGLPFESAAPAESIRVVEAGALRATLEIVRRIKRSLICQRISLSARSRRIDFQTQVEWHERQTLLKVAFPVAVRADDATYHIQWGTIKRPTHRNTSWEQAKYEVAAHYFADLSEYDYGVSLLNDCKYGYDVRDNVLRLTLIKSPIYPDPNADLGTHTFTYSLLPHADPSLQTTFAEAYRLNVPVLIVPSSGKPAAGPLSLVSSNVPTVIVETVKRAEDGDDLVVRLYRCANARGMVTLRFGVPIQAAWRADLLESPLEQLPVHENSVTFALKPFEILTLRVALGRHQ
ncbi:MAG: glycoside hydrolase family 38 C-terminal domain-containing protein [Anaerolineae bacterium]|nr:glycoside hydrolase family 38 C-terminal domain-containing protein [Anaerolineae bacterium]